MVREEINKNINGNITDRDNALFEAGIKLGALYHQFIGTPLSLENKIAVESAIQKSISVQPFAENVSVKINEKMIEEELNSTFKYTELSGKMLDVKLVVRYNSVRVFASLQFDEKLNYPLMKVDQVEE
ncbi:dihydroneopterin aldolase family protein [Methanolapillus millepedarum]|uniref:Dihydroneopterin aldolase n=1 Tax=Methanolapillus millepedarum TaxID=3028296 RepID=A0AA96ZUY5_9EURY|nr:hypothetical protein MsAc7_17060 [Methanosarcinaceae archaeon Ac7]